MTFRVETASERKKPYTVEINTIEELKQFCESIRYRDNDTGEIVLSFYEDEVFGGIVFRPRIIEYDGWLE